MELTIEQETDLLLFLNQEFHNIDDDNEGYGTLKSLLTLVKRE